MQPRLRPLVAALVIVLGTSAGLALADWTPDPLVGLWLKSHAKPFATCEPGDRTDDLKALRAIVGNARIVALGEGTHGTREFFQMKHRITQYLASQMGFTVFAIEANLPEAWKLNDYVLGGPGNPKELIAGMYFWTWDTEEVLAMVEWMRRFNASGRGRIEFTGFDMQVPDTAAAIVRRWLAVHDTAWVDSLKAIRKATATRDPGFVTSTGGLPVAEFAGHRVRYSGYVRTENVSGMAGLWMRADSPEKSSVAFDNMADQHLRGTMDWKRWEFTLDIPPQSNALLFGVLMVGTGRAWFDSLAIEVDGKPWSSSTIDLALEDAAGPIGLGRQTVTPRYSIAMDEQVATSGKRSLRLAAGPATPDTLGDVLRVRALTAARRLVEHLEAERRNPPPGTTAAQADWIARNAHVLLQHSLLEGKRRPDLRDSSMAANLEWIADEARKGAKVVVWAHNGHVSRRAGWMGDWLTKHYGDQVVNVGFATHDGEFGAMKDGALRSNALVPSPPGSIEWYAHDTGLPRFVVDLGTARRDTAVAAALRRGLTMRSIGALAQDIQFAPTAVIDEYDALLWVDHTTAARPLGGTGAKRKDP